jgi:hypothetical protein
MLTKKIPHQIKRAYIMLVDIGPKMVQIRPGYATSIERVTS